MKFTSAILTAILMILIGTQANAQSFGLGFSNGSLRGTCIWHAFFLETTSGSQSQAGPATILTPITFDGRGNLTLTDYHVNLNGTETDAVNIRGTYQVDKDGHGTFSYTSAAQSQTVTFDFFISRSRNVIHTSLRAQASLAQTPRVSDGTCDFSE
jgi:hypothetical protein